MRTLMLSWLAALVMATVAPPSNAGVIVDTASTHIRLDMPRLLKAGPGMPQPGNLAAVMDLDGDVYPEVVSAPAWQVFMDLAADETDHKLPLPVPAWPYAIATGDINRDGHIDLVASLWGTNQVAVLLADGTGGFAAATVIATGRGPTGIALADFNGDGGLDIAVGCSDDSTLRVLLQQYGGTFAAAPTIAIPAMSGTWVILVAADVNGDGRADLVTTGQGTGAVECRLSLGGGAFSQPVRTPDAGEPYGIAAGDLDGDGDVDLVTSRYSDKSALLTGDGTGQFTVNPMFPRYWTSFGGGGVAIADMDSDGRLDVVFG